MTGKTYGPPRRRATAVPTPPQKWWGREARHRFAIRIPVADVIDDTKAIAGHYALTAPYRIPRWCWRHRDNPITPCLPPLVIFPAVGWLLALLPYPPAPRAAEWAVAALAALAAALTVGMTPSFVEAPITERRTRAMDRTLRAKINGLTVQAVQDRSHATTVIATVAPGLDPDDYDRQKSTLASSFREPLYITKDTPGRLELRLEHDDLLAKEAKWGSVAELTPNAIPVGHDWDGEPFPFTLAHQSLLVAGVRGAGKSAFLNGLIARLVAMDNVELYLADPLEGVDLGIWWNHPNVHEVWDSEETAIKGIGYFDDLRANRVRQMVTGDRPVQLARWSTRFPLRALILDEIASVMLWGDPKQQKTTAASLHSVIAKGRKSNDVVIAATQHPSATVLPTLIRGQFTNVLGLRVGRREQTRQVFGDGMTGDWDLSTIPADQPGRGIWSDGGHMTPVRTCGLWGRELRRVAHDLAQPPTQPLHGATRNGFHSEDEREIDVPTTDVARKADRVRAALPIDGPGLTADDLIQATGIARETVYYHLRKQADRVGNSRPARYRRRP